MTWRDARIAAVTHAGTESRLFLPSRPHLTVAGAASALTDS